MSITMIWAMAQDGLIGRDNTMPWRIPHDFAYFKEKTMGKRMLMGRKTWESLGSRPLPGRTSIVLTRDPAFAPQHAEVMHTLEEAIAAGSGGEELMVIGGAEVYALMLPYADKLLVTRIDETFEGETYFPAVNWEEWAETSSTPGIRDDQNPYNYRWLVYERSR